MKKEALAQKLARKSFESAAIQQSWQVHAKTFGPLLADSFPENYQAKVHLCAALNRISRREGEEGRKKLTELQKHLEIPMDHAAWNFFMGLSYEAEAATALALPYYRECCRHDPGFFMPYLKLAKLAQDARDFDTAEENWHKAISLAPAPAIEAVYHTNLAGCLAQMHRFEESYAALMQSRRLAPVQQGRDSFAAILYAAMGDRENAENCLSWVDKDTPQLAPGTRDAVEKILRGENPHYTPVETDFGKVDAFWTWFQEQKIPEQEQIAERLWQVFPFLDREPMVCVENNTVFLSDWYMTALAKGFETLLARCPEGIKTRWQFTVVRYREASEKRG